MRRLTWIFALALLLLATLASPAHAATPIESRYSSDAALRALLGQPTGSEYAVSNGRMRWYQWGNLYWSSSTGVREVHGAIRHRYHLLGGPGGFLGFPETDEGRLYFKQDVPEQRIGDRNDFEGGAISWSTETRTSWMCEPFADAVPYYSFPDLGHPVDDEQPARNGRMVELASGTRLYLTPTGMHELTH